MSTLSPPALISANSTALRPNRATAKPQFWSRPFRCCGPGSPVTATGGRATPTIPRRTWPPPSRPTVSVALGDKVFVFTQPTRTASIPECKTAFDRAHVATEAVLKHYQASGAKDDALFETYTKMGEADDAAFIRCYGEHVATQAFYPALVRQAQALADLPQAGK